MLGRLSALRPGVGGVLGAVAALDLTRWALAAGVVARLDQVPVVLTPTASLLSGVFEGLVGQFLGVAVFGGSFYLFGRRAYAGTRLVGDRGVAALFAVAGVGFTLILGGLAGDLPYAQGIALLLVGDLLAGAAIAGYLHRRRGWAVTDPRRGDSPMDWLFGDDTAVQASAQYADTRPLARLNHAVHALAVVLLLGFPPFLAGLVAQILLHAYPLPDLLVLGYLCGAVLATRLPDDIAGPGRLIDVPDVEERLLGAITRVTETPKGVPTVVLLLAGAFPSAGYVFVGVTLAGRAASAPASLSPAAASLVVGGVVSLVAAGAYGLWYWARVVRRLDPFLARWDGIGGPHDPPTRPVGLLVPQAVVVAVIFTVTTLQGLARTVAAVAWPLLPLGLYWCVRRTRRRRPQRVDREDIAVLVGGAVSGVGLLVGANIDWLAALAAGDPLPPVTAPPLLVPVAAIGLFLFAWADIRRYTSQRDGRWAYAQPAIIIAIGPFALAAAAVVRPSARPAFLALAVGFPLLGLLNAVAVRWRD